MGFPAYNLHRATNSPKSRNKIRLAFHFVERKEHYMLARRYEFYVLVARTISPSFAALTREILFMPLEHKIYIFSPPCNILYNYLDMILRQIYRLSKKMSPLSVAHTVAPSLQVTLLIITSLSARLLTYQIMMIQILTVNQKIFHFGKRLAVCMHTSVVNMWLNRILAK